jgi:hypothetical protein
MIQKKFHTNKQTLLNIDFFKFIDFIEFKAITKFVVLEVPQNPLKRVGFLFLFFSKNCLPTSPPASASVSLVLTNKQ